MRISPSNTLRQCLKLNRFVPDGIHVNLSDEHLWGKIAVGSFINGRYEISEEEKRIINAWEEYYIKEGQWERCDCEMCDGDIRPKEQFLTKSIFD